MNKKILSLLAICVLATQGNAVSLERYDGKGKINWSVHNIKNTKSACKEMKNIHKKIYTDPHKFNAGAICEVSMSNIGRIGEINQNIANFLIEEVGGNFKANIPDYMSNSVKDSSYVNLVTNYNMFLCAIKADEDKDLIKKLYALLYANEGASEKLMNHKNEANEIIDISTLFIYLNADSKIKHTALEAYTVLEKRYIGYSRIFAWTQRAIEDSETNALLGLIAKGDYDKAILLLKNSRKVEVTLSNLNTLCNK